MIANLLDLLRERTQRLRLLLFAASASAAVAVGFVLVSPARAKPLIMSAGYYYIFAVFGLFVFFLWRVGAARREQCLGFLRRPGVVGLAILAGALFSVWTDTFHHKILFDEYVLEGTAWQMHATKEVSTPIRGYEIFGSWLTIDGFLDKRPLFFPFLISLLHDLTGFRITNAFVLNVALAPACLGLLYWLARRVSARGPAIVAVALMATLPLFGQNVSSGSMELLNLVMIVVTMTAAALYLRAPDDDRLSLLVVSVALLSQCRYESALFALPAALVVVLGWLRVRRMLLPWAVLLAPWLLVPYAWHNRVVSATPILWQLREGETTRFSVQYLAGNLQGARRFFFAFEPLLPGSAWLALLGTAGGLWAIVVVICRIRKARELRGEVLSPEATTVALFSAAIAANLALVMFYYWSRLDEPIASRFALPALLVLTLLGAWLIGWLDRQGWRGTRIGAGGLCAWVLIWGAPAYAVRNYTDVNLVMQEVEWELSQIVSRPGPLLLLTNKGTMPYLLEHIPTMNLPMIRTRAPQIAWHMHEGTFREVLVVQVVRPTSVAGDLGVDPDDVLPDGVQLEPVVQKRFGGRWIRISRIVKIETTPAATAPASTGDS